MDNVDYCRTDCRRSEQKKTNKKINFFFFLINIKIKMINLEKNTKKTSKNKNYWFDSTSVLGINLILKNAANEISPFLKIIFDQSLQTGKLPDDWVEAQKRGLHSPANYRPMSLTCVCAKLLEHIICKQIMSHFSDNIILIPVQHGFRSTTHAKASL